MKIYDFVKTWLGWIHFITSIIAMLTDAYILFQSKGTRRHKQAGYIYVASMVLVCGSALGIYNLTGKFGVFHIVALFIFWKEKQGENILQNEKCSFCCLKVFYAA